MFFKKSKKEEENVKVNNKHITLIDKYDNDEEEDDEMQCYEMKEEDSGSDVKRKEKNYETKVIKSNGDNNKIVEVLGMACEKCKILKKIEI